MNIGLIIVTGIIILIMFGAGQRVLDKMRLNDKWALLILTLVVIGLLIPPIKIGEYFSFSIGGFLIPFGICVYLIIRCGFSYDLLRAAIGIIVSTGVIVGLNFLLPSTTPEDIQIDNVLMYGAVCGLVSYLLGRSRRNAFICSVIGVSLAQVVEFMISYFGYNTLTKIGLGVNGAFDTIVVSTLISVGLCELIGKTVEAVKGKNDKKFDLDKGEFINTIEEKKWYEKTYIYYVCFYVYVAI